MARQFNREMIVFVTNGGGTTGYLRAENEFGPLLEGIYKNINLK